MPREGGAEKQMRSVLAQLDAQGVQATVVTQVLEGQPRRAMVSGTGVAIERVGSRFAFRRLPRVGQGLFVLVALTRVVALRPTTVLSLQFGSASTAASLGARALGVKHIVRLTGGGTSVYRSESFARRSNPLGRLLVWLISTGPDVVVVAPAQHLLDDFKEAFPKARVQVELVANGVDPPSVEEFEGRDRHGVVWYARGGAERSVEYFLSIAAGCPAILFNVIGEEIAVGEFPNIQSLGWCEDVYSVLSRARVLLNTSKTEGSPNMALQAIASGCYVLGAENAGITELVRNYPNHTFTYAWAAPEASVRQTLMRLHAQELPGAALPPTPEIIALRWHELLTEKRKA